MPYPLTQSAPARAKADTLEALGTFRWRAFELLSVPLGAVIVALNIPSDWDTVWRFVVPALAGASTPLVVVVLLFIWNVLLAYPRQRNDARVIAEGAEFEVSVLPQGAQGKGISSPIAVPLGENPSMRLVILRYEVTNLASDPVAVRVHSSASGPWVIRGPLSLSDARRLAGIATTAESLLSDIEDSGEDVWVQVQNLRSKESVDLVVLLQMFPPGRDVQWRDGALAEIELLVVEATAGRFVRFRAIDGYSPKWSE